MKTNTNFLKKLDVNYFINYINAETIEAKEKIYNKHLYPYIDYQIEAILKQYNSNNNVFIKLNWNDLKQELHMYIIIKILPNLKLEKIQGIQNLIYISIKNQLFNHYNFSQVKKNIKYDNNQYIFRNIDDEIDGDIDNFDIIEKINEKINEKILSIDNANCTASVYLQLLKNYVIDNDYNSEGFGDFVMEKMNIKRSTYLNLSHNLGLKTVSFKTKKVK